MKKFVSLILAITLIIGLAFCVHAEDAPKKLQFNENGKFNILHITDCQDVYPANEKMFTYINYVLKNYKIDLVVLGGDNDVSVDHKEEAIAALVKPYVDNKVYFTMVFGNHDHQQGFTNPQLFDMYVKYGGEYFLGTNEVDPSAYADDQLDAKAGTHFLPVYSSKDENKAAYGLYMFDSGNYVYDEKGESLGYGCVETYQIDWYKSVRDANVVDGKYLPSIAFQHIVCGDVYDELYFSSAINLGELGRSFYGKNYTFVPKTNNFHGFLSEAPCPGYYNYGQLDAMAEKGDVKAVFCGHDHTNTYDVIVKGVHNINSPGLTYHSYSDEMTHGARLIELDEATGNFTSSLITINGLAVKDADFAKAMDISQATAKFYVVIADIALKLADALGIFGKILTSMGVK